MSTNQQPAAESFWQSLFKDQMPVSPIPSESFARHLLAIKPNYERIRKIYTHLCLAGSLLVLLFQIMLYLVFKLELLPIYFKTSEFIHLLKYLIIPSAINFSAVLFSHLMHKYYRGNEFVLNASPIFAMVIICATTASAHSVYSITMMFLCLPIFMSAVYGRANMLLCTSGLCCVGLVSSLICRLLSPYWQATADTKLIPEVVAAFAFIILTTIAALVMIMLLNVQKGRLVQATSDAEKARFQAQQANNAKSEFLANMSHEIRTPLNAILGMTEMISREATEKRIREYASDVQQASNALLAIINDVLDISKIESGNIEIVESKYELGSLINDSYNMVAVRWREKGLTATIICDPNLPRMLYGDEYHLRQIIVNLLSNAVKYTNEGGIIMRVSGEDNGDILRMEVAIKDSGIGIRREDIPKLFGKFTRLDVSKNAKVEGTGLGLSIAKQLVELMNGTIEVESVYGVGSTFTVRIPQKIADRTPIGDIHSTYLDMHGDIERYHQSFEAPDASLLVVDDVLINLEVIKKLLEKTKIKVDTASSGKECLKKVCETRYDMILMDHMMPEMDGVDTLRIMRGMIDCKNHSTPVVMLTANAMLGAREEYIDAGFVDYLAKPVRGARLERMILQYLPKSKVEKCSGSVSEATEAKVFTLEDLRAAVPEMDISSGLSYCADDKSFYQSMLKEFIESDKAASLAANYASGDWANYRISAHSLKSAAKMVGFSALSAEAASLEEAAKTGDIARIRENHEKVLSHFASIAEKLTGQGL